MPIAAPPASSQAPPVLRPTERIAAVWMAPDGSAWPLVTPGGDVRAQATAALGKAVPLAVTLDPNPRGGAVLRHVQDLEQYLIMPVLVRGNSHQEFVERWEQLGYAFSQTKRKGPGWLRVQRPDGSAREIACYYQSGWEGRAEQGWDWDVADALTLVCPDPYWRSTVEVVLPFEYQVTTDFYNEFMGVASGRVIGAATVTNPGRAVAWPRWVISGPLDSLTATNHTTGETFELDPDWDSGGSLILGDTVGIESDPFRARGPADEIWTGAITGIPWGLEPGPNEVEFVAAGAAAGTRIELRFYPRYETA